ncbi:MAG: glycosyltransferase family 4 protein [Leucobacter sp.]
MRIAITSRIFDPEPSAAAVRLNALAETLVTAGHEVTVLTVRLPKGQPDGDSARAYRVRRAPVLRDRAGYVRGYLQYMSFDVPLFFRILFGRKQDSIVVEPPPTTGLFVRLAASIRRTPYIYYAADIWADAASQTGANAYVLRILRWVERRALRGATAVLAVSDGVVERLGELGVTRNVVKIGNGVDVRAYGSEGSAESFAGPTIVYAGTTSEWHGAEIVVDAFKEVREHVSDARLVFVGGGSERIKLQKRASDLGLLEAVDFLPVVAPKRLSELLRGAQISVATCRPGAGYDFAFPTKLYSSVACGTPIVYAGPGPAQDFVRTVVAGDPLGIGVSWNAPDLAEAFRRMLNDRNTADRRALVATWAATAVSVSGPAAHAAEVVARSMRRMGQ